MNVFRQFLLFIINILFIFTIHAQNQQELFIEPLDESQAPDISTRCNLGDVIVCIKSLIPNLQFSSNMIDLDEIVYNDVKREYIICHEKGETGRFLLTVISPEHVAGKIYIDGNSPKYAFNISSKLSTGKLHIRTNPQNAWIEIGGLKSQLADTAIEMKTGEYKIKIMKDGYTPIDTTVIIPANGMTNFIDLTLEESFSRLLLDILPNDGLGFSLYPVIEIDSFLISMSELINNPNVRAFDNHKDIEYFKLYKGGYIPIPEGSYNISINTQGFKPYSTNIDIPSKSTVPLHARLEPITGYLTVIDEGNAIGAKVFINNKEVGTIPIFKQKIRIGEGVLHFEKEGFISLEKEPFIVIKENTEIDISVKMAKYIQYHFMSNPTGAEVLIDGKREGFTPVDIPITEGVHEVSFKKSGYQIREYLLDVARSGNILYDTFLISLDQSYPILIKSEEDGLFIVIKQNDTIITSASGGRTPAEIQLPYGEYQLELYNDKHKSKRYKGKFTHNGSSSTVFAPCFSRGTFTYLVGDYLFGQTKLWKMDDNNNKLSTNNYSLFAKAHFGRFNLCPGLSTSILRTTIVNVSKNTKGQLIDAKEENINVNIDNKKYPNYMFSMTCILLNGEFRMGGYFSRYFGLCFLGSYAWYPSMKFLPITHLGGHDIFVGIEASSRISYFNMNVKLGVEIFNGKYNYLVNKNKEDIYIVFDENNPENNRVYNQSHFTESFKMVGFVASVGFTLGQKKSKGNNMLRLW